MLRLEGILPPMVTPLLDGERVDEEGLARQVERLIAAANIVVSADVDGLKARLHEIMPTERDISVHAANQSLVLSNGLLTVGLVGSPGNNGGGLNVNGARKPLSSGDVVHLDVDAKTNCNITLQSFDLFRAVVHAVCNTRP